MEKKWFTLLDFWKDVRVHLPEHLWKPGDFCMKIHQIEGIYHCVTRKRGLISYPPRWGKTPTSIVTLLVLDALYKNAFPCLVVVEATNEKQWVKELQHWTGFPASTIVDCREAKRKHKQKRKPKEDPPVVPRFFVIGYHALKSLTVEQMEELMGHRPLGSILCDESQRLGSSTSKITACVTKWARRATYRYLLSGTPAVRVRQWYPQLKILAPHLVPPTFHEFGMRFCGTKQIWNPVLKKNVYLFNGTSHVKELKAILAQVVVSTKIKVVLTEKCRDKIKLPVTDKEKKQLDKQEEKLQACIAAGKGPEDLSKTVLSRGAKDQEGNSLFKQIQEMTKQCYRIKEPYVVDYVTRLLDRETEVVVGKKRKRDEGFVKTILFASRLRILEKVRDLLDTRQIKYVYVDGQVDPKERSNRLQSFRTDSSLSVALLSVSACCAGLTLPEAQRIIMLDLNWNAAMLLQAEDRACRILDSSSSLFMHTKIDVYYLQLAHSIEERMWKNFQDKIKTVEAFR